MIPIVVAAMVNLIIAGAVELVWRRRPEARHARLWIAAFLLIGLGWMISLWTMMLAPLVPRADAAPTLCWLAATLLFVHGLRRRGGRRDRMLELAAIWTAVAFATAVLADVARDDSPVFEATVPLLSALGLLFAAFAIGPRDLRALWLDGVATGLVAGLALMDLALAWLRLDRPADATVLLGLAPILSLPFYVGLGLAAMLLLNNDLTTALDRLARTDPLTRIWNRRGFEEGSAALLARLRLSPDRVAAVAIADIDSFKAINDRLGHGAGDAALFRFARLLSRATQRGELLARLGGEEFALLAIGTDGAALTERMERARGLVALRGEDETDTTPLTASFGVAQLNPQSLSLRDALERADRALYAAKAAGKNRVILADPAT